MFETHVGLCFGAEQRVVWSLRLKTALFNWIFIPETHTRNMAVLLEGLVFRMRNTMAVLCRLFQLNYVSLCRIKNLPGADGVAIIRPR